MGKPAARISDMHVCPATNPGPVPHVGGPILPAGCPTVLIGSLPAARMGDSALCVGPMDVIAQGSTTVLIGGMPAARMTDSCAHGGKIVAGMPTVLIGDRSAGGGGMLVPDVTPGGEAQIKAFQAAKYGGKPFCEVCSLEAPKPTSFEVPWQDYPPAVPAQVAAMKEAKEVGNALVEMCPLSKEAQEKEKSNTDVVNSKTGFNMDPGDLKPSFSINAEKEWVKEEGELGAWGDDNNFLKAGAGEASLSSGIKVAGDEIEANLIKGKAGVKAVQGQVGAEGKYGGASLAGELLSAEAEAQAGVTIKPNEVYAGVKAGAGATVAKVEGKGFVKIPIPFTDRSLVIGLAGEASFGAKAEAGLGVGQNPTYGTFIEAKAKAALGPGLGANVILGIK